MLPVELRHGPVVRLHVVAEELFTVGVFLFVDDVAVDADAEKVGLVLEGRKVTAFKKSQIRATSHQLIDTEIPGVDKDNVEEIILPTAV